MKAVSVYKHENKRQRHNDGTAYSKEALYSVSWSSKRAFKPNNTIPRLVRLQSVSRPSQVPHFLVSPQQCPSTALELS